MRNLTLLSVVLGALALQGCTDAGLLPEEGDSSSSAQQPSSSISSTPTSSAGSSDPVTPPSSSSSAAPDPGGDFGDPVAGATTFAADCTGCHTNNGDGTFGGNFPFNVNSFVYPSGGMFGDGGYSADTVEDLANFIGNTMPFPAATCVDDCAENTAAFLWSLREDSGPGEPDPGPGVPGSVQGGKDFIERLNGLVGGIERATAADADAISPDTGYLGDFLGAEAAAQLDDFLAQVEESGITGSDLDAILGALGGVGNAVVEVLGDSISGNAIPTNVGGVAIGFTDQSGVKTFTVSDNVNGCSEGVCNVAVDFTMVMDFERNATGGESGNVTTLASSGRELDITVTGTFTSGGVELSFNDVAGSNISMDELYLEMVEGEDITEVYFELPGLVINLPITLANNSVSVDANVQGSAAMVELELVLAADTEISVLEVTDLALNASVVLANTTGDSVTADLLLDSDGTSSDYTYVITEAGVLEIDGETAQSFMGLVGSLDVNAILSGASPIGLSGNIARINNDLIGFDNVTIEHSGSNVTLSGVFTNAGGLSELTAVDAGGYRLTMQADSNGALTGNLVDGAGSEIGTVSGKIGDGQVSFADGTATRF